MPARPGIIATPSSDPLTLGGRAVSAGGVATTTDIDTECCPNCCCKALSWQVVLADVVLCTCAQMTTTSISPDGMCAQAGGGAFGGPPYCFFDFAGDPNGTFCLDQLAAPPDPGQCTYIGDGPNITITVYDDLSPARGNCANNPVVVTTTTQIILQINTAPGFEGTIASLTVSSPGFTDPTTGLNTTFTFFGSGSTNRYCGVKCLNYPALANLITDCFYLNGAGSGATGGTATLTPSCDAC